MVKTKGQDWRSDFPVRDEVEDFSGRMRIFVITCHERPHGLTVRAQEEGTRGTGYEFAAYSETSAYAALGRVRQKMQRALATRHITRSADGYRMLHSELSGRITCRSDGDVVLIVDGVPLSLENFSAILATHEGWNFEMKIVDALE
ncbi:MAG: hypothetical protein QME66_08735 [Candidatus Eisenbacteria bacterium]|nr:hypothetical protein [Candidatus Eisenbacteria bacterium]